MTWKCTHTLPLAVLLDDTECVRKQKQLQRTVPLLCHKDTDTWPGSVTTSQDSAPPSPSDSLLVDLFLILSEKKQTLAATTKHFFSVFIRLKTKFFCGGCKQRAKCAVFIEIYVALRKWNMSEAIKRARVLENTRPTWTELPIIQCAANIMNHRLLFSIFWQFPVDVSLPQVPPGPIFKMYFLKHCFLEVKRKALVGEQTTSP